ncbi:MAG: alpha/beta hydrolase [bacterium]
MRIPAVAVALLFAPTLASPALAEVVNVEVRPGATMRYLAISGGQPRAAAILLAGGNGVLRLSPSGSIGALSLNFLIRSREAFVRQGLYVGALDAASDRQGGMDGAIRLSPQHSQDIGKVIADVKNRTGSAAVWLIGTSAGTLSAASAGARLSVDQAMRPRGIVLTSTMTTLDASGYCGKSVYDASLGEIRVPVLVASHQDDGCQCSPGSSAVGARLLASLAGAPAKEHKIFTGGSAPITGPCEERAPHGFFGIEDGVVEFIADWIKSH